MAKEKLKKQQLALRIDQSIYGSLKDISMKKSKSINRLVVESINNCLIQEQQNSNQTLIEQNDKDRLIEYRLRFAVSEGDILKKYAQGNSWSVPKEIRYRVMGTMSDNGKISPEELEAIRGIKVSINALGNNINRIIREDRLVTNEDREACIMLSDNISNVRELIMLIIEKSKKKFLLKK